MKRLMIIVAIIFGICSITFAQTGTFQEAASTHYRVFSEVGLTHAQETADMLDAYVGLYNNYLHFDTSTLETKLKVRIFANKTNFDSYLSTLIPQKRDSFVYLQYKDLAKSELLGFYVDDDAFQKAMVHHGFVQFLKAFVPNPPLWLQKGFAVYLEKSTYDTEAQSVAFVDNLVWVKTVKNIINGANGYELISLPDLLTLTVDRANIAIESFYAESWALVSFLTDSNLHQYNRLLWDTISSLDSSASMSENGTNVASEVFSWVSTDSFYVDFLDFMTNVKTFPELVTDGMTFYASDDYEGAEMFFLRAIERNGRHDIPYYYLGLINYARNDYNLAEYYYLTSQQMGGELGLTYYALGVNAYADNRFDAAKSYLSKAGEADPFGYGEKSMALMERIGE